MRLRNILLPVFALIILQAGGCSFLGGSPTTGGVYLSRSAGAQFDQIANLTFADQEPGNTAQLALNPGHRPAHANQTIYLPAKSDGLIFSEDGGESWQQILTPLASVSDVVALASNVIVIAGTDSDGQGFILRTIDQGKSYQTVLTVPRPTDQNRGLINITSDATSSVVINIQSDPHNTDRIYAGTSLGNILVGQQSGKTWQTVYTLETGQFGGNDTSKNLISKLVASPHVAGELLVVTSEKRLIRIDLNSETQEVLDIPRDLSASDSPFGNFGGERDVLDVSYIRGFVDAIFAGVDDGAVITRNRGEVWEQTSLPIDVAGQFTTAVVTASPTNPRRLLVAINDVIYRSEDGGDTWNTFSLGLPGHNIRDLLIDPSNAANVVAVTSPDRS